jgi:hypothetical protein
MWDKQSSLNIRTGSLAWVRNSKGRRMVAHPQNELLRDGGVCIVSTAAVELSLLPSRFRANILQFSRRRDLPAILISCAL